MRFKFSFILFHGIPDIRSIRQSLARSRSVSGVANIFESRAILIASSLDIQVRIFAGKEVNQRPPATYQREEALLKASLRECHARTSSCCFSGLYQRRQGSSFAQ